MPAGFRPMVVDNGSTDGSAEIARAAGARVVVAAQRGYGAACHAGLLAATSDVVLVMDADASLDPQELPRWSRAGRRWPGRSGARPADDPVAAGLAASARLANVALAATVRRRTGLPLRDLGPVRAFRREALLGLESDRPTVRLPAGDACSLRTPPAGGSAEVPVRYMPRTGRSKVTGTLPGYVRTVRDMRAVLAR